MTVDNLQNNSQGYVVIIIIVWIMGLYDTRSLQNINPTCQCQKPTCPLRKPNHNPVYNLLSGPAYSLQTDTQKSL